MREADFYAKVRDVLHAPPYRICRKLQDRYLKGVPDSIYSICIGSRSTDGWIELKYHERWPARGGDLSLGLRVEQQRFIEQCAATNGNAFVLVGVGDTAYLIEPRGDGARTLDVGVFTDAQHAKRVSCFTCKIDKLAQLLVYLTRVGMSE